MTKPKWLEWSKRKGAFEARLREEGGLPLWRNFLMIREGLVKAGWDRRSAWHQAMEMWERGVRAEDAKTWKAARPMTGDMNPNPPEISADRWTELADAAVGRHASETKEIRWVAKYMLVSPEKIDLAEVPSPGAVGLLKWCRENTINRGDFWNKIYTKLLPRQSDMKRDSLKDDQAASVERLIDELKA